MDSDKTYLDEYKEVFFKFLQDTTEENILQTVLRSHLYIENALETIIEKSFENPKVLLTEKNMFANKLSLVFALGVIPHEFNVLLKYFNKSVRNKYAHDLSFELTEEHLEQMKSRFDKQTKEAHQMFIDLLIPRIAQDDRYSDSLDSLSVKLRIIMASLLTSLKKYHVSYLKIPLDQEVNEITEIVELLKKDENEQKIYIAERSKYVLDEMGKLSKSLVE